jgi:hypothetical protein
MVAITEQSANLFRAKPRLIAALSAAETETERSGGAGRKRGVGKMNSRPALAFAAAEFRANEVGAPPLYYS